MSKHLEENKLRELPRHPGIIKTNQNFKPYILILANTGRQFEEYKVC